MSTENILNNWFKLKKSNRAERRRVIASFRGLSLRHKARLVAEYQADAVAILKSDQDQSVKP
jgi:hypothetical protein